MQNSIDSRIRIMRIISRMNVGGPAVQISGLMQGLDSDTFEHRLYTGFCDEHEADYLHTVATSIDAIRIEGLGRHLSIFDDLRSIIYLIKEIRLFKPHIIHTHTAKAGVIGRIASILSGHPSIRVHTFHGHLLFGYFGRAKRYIVILIEKILARYTHLLLAVGSRVMLDLIEVGVGDHSKFRVISPGLQIQSLISQEIARNKLGLNPNQFQCAFIGRITQIKRPDRFLNVVKELNSRHTDISFFIAGEGDLFESSQKEISEQSLPVSFLGWQTNIELVLSAADLVILTSDNEGTPLCLIQAGMAGLPVISTNVGSVSEVVIDGTTGILTSFDIQEIADAVEKLRNDEKLRSRMGAAGSAFTLNNFGVDRLVKDHRDVYLHLVASRTTS